jgi:hypothetical protein
VIVSQDRTIKLKTFSRSHVLEVEVERVVNFKLALDARGPPPPAPAASAERTILRLVVVSNRTG